MEEYKEDAHTCLKCGSEIYGRSDKKFCSAKCKNDYHNQAGSSSKRLRNRILTDLNSNYEVLEKLMRLGISAISIYDVEALGFKPAIVTGYAKVRSHDEYRCFDIKYCQSPSRIFNIRRMELEEARRAVCRTPPPQSSCKSR